MFRIAQDNRVSGWSGALRWRWLALAVLGLVLLPGAGAGPWAALADEQNDVQQAGLLVQFEDGSIVTDCVDFAEPISITAAEFLQRSELGVQIAELDYGGSMVCELAGAGCDIARGEMCLCAYDANSPDSRLWRAYQLQGGAWQEAWPPYIDRRPVYPSSVEAWVWTYQGDHNGHGVRRPEQLLSFEEICLADQTSPTVTTTGTTTATPATATATAATPTANATATILAATMTALPPPAVFAPETAVSATPTASATATGEPATTVALRIFLPLVRTNDPPVVTVAQSARATVTAIRTATVLPSPTASTVPIATPTAVPLVASPTLPVATTLPTAAATATIVPIVPSATPPPTPTVDAAASATAAILQTEFATPPPRTPTAIATATAQPATARPPATATPAALAQIPATMSPEQALAVAQPAADSSARSDPAVQSAAGQAAETDLPETLPARPSLQFWGTLGGIALLIVLALLGMLLMIQGQQRRLDLQDDLFGDESE